MESIVSSCLAFGPWRYDRRLGRLFRAGEPGQWIPTPIGSRAAEILTLLLREPGVLVSKDAVMDAVWPDTTVEANNLTVQIAALRRVLDEGAAGPSYIQTVPGRGYRLICPVDGISEPGPACDVPPPSGSPAVIPEALAPAPARPWLRRHWMRWRWQLGGALAAVGLAVAFGPRFGATPTLPRMSVVVLPFEGLGGNADDDRGAAALTDDLTAALSLTTDAVVMNAKASRTLDGRTKPVQQSGREAGARYVVTGSERRLADILRVNVQIVSTESAAVLWTDRFDIPMTDPAAGQEAAVARLQDGIETRLISLEVARGEAERATKPDALDLHLRARLLELQPPTPTRMREIRSLHERAVQLDPSSDLNRLWLIGSMLDDEDQNPHGRKTVFEQTAKLLTTLEASQPAFWGVTFQKLDWLYWQENRRCREVVDLAEHFVQHNHAVRPVRQAYRWLGGCKIVLGHADEAVAVMEHAIALAPNPYQSRNYRNLQFALLLLGRYDESIRAGERALAENPDDVGYERARLIRRLAAAYALGGQLELARHKLAEAVQIQPFLTLRAFNVTENSSPVFAAQLARVLDGLRLAGLRDHAEEGADFRTASDDRLHQDIAGPTPLTAPAVTTIGTDDLVRLRAGRRPLIVDALTNFAGRSIPGAVGLRYVGSGGTLTDLAQDRLRSTLRDVTKTDLDTPVVAVGWNSESFDGRNLALRLVALGYTHVFWYRGGREAWEVRGLPEAELAPQDW